MDKPVTAREREILELISQGFSTKEIAGRLFISGETVKSHRHHLFNKFSARNSPHLVQKALIEGILSDKNTTYPTRIT
ncbi:MAG: LuxR family transcriptional regulator [Deltaproteobacteria bacterium]|nr:MAG: LuxR family transcriptional regulator [Deltaproteobacteria bacterium]